MNNLVQRGQVLELEEHLRKYPQVELQTNHHFAPGVYVRELLIPAGTILTGKIHRYETMNILISGEIRVTTDDGMQTLTGPMIFNSQAGTKKAAITITDTIWVNVHPTELTDLDEIETEFIAPDYDALRQEDRKCLG